MFKPFIRVTNWNRELPRWYVTYHQELEAPYRYAEKCVVVGVGRRGLVVGRWTDQWDDEDMANRVAIGARSVRPWWDEPAGADAVCGYDEPDDGSFGCLVT